MSQSVDNQTKPDVKDLLTGFIGNILSFVDFEKSPEEQGQKAFDEIVKLEAYIQKLLAQAELKGRMEATETISRALRTAPKDSWYGTLSETVASLKEIA